MINSFYAQYCIPLLRDELLKSSTMSAADNAILIHSIGAKPASMRARCHPQCPDLGDQSSTSRFESEGSEFKCPHPNCPLFFRSSSIFATHFSQHVLPETDRTALWCPDCPDRFVCSTKLIKHQHHSHQSSAWCICNGCRCSFKAINLWKRHNHVNNACAKQHTVDWDASHHRVNDTNDISAQEEQRNPHSPIPPIPCMSWQTSTVREYAMISQPGFAESNENWEPISTPQMHHDPLNPAQNRWATPLDPSAEYFATDVIVSRWHVNRNSFSTNQTPQAWMDSVQQVTTAPLPISTEHITVADSDARRESTSTEQTPQAWMDSGQQITAVPPTRPTEHIATNLVTSNSETQWESTSTEYTPQATTEATPGTLSNHWDPVVPQVRSASELTTESGNNRDLIPRDECQLSDWSGYKVLERKITSGEPVGEVDEFLFGEWPIPMPKGLSAFELFLQ
ncbi:hypothetical protein B0J14DRAFT_603119, partial [Halenospora varia]